MNENPYQSPASVDTPADDPTELRKRAQAAAEAPAAIVMMLCTGSLLLQAVILTDGFPDPVVSIRLLHMGVQLFIMGGAIRMLKLRSLWLARAAMVLACIPLFSPLFGFGIPFGIWALVVLSRPHVKAAFR